MPAATVGSAYSERRHIESTRKPYDSRTEQSYRNTVDALTDLAELDLGKRKVSSLLEDRTS